MKYSGMGIASGMMEGSKDLPRATCVKPNVDPMAPLSEKQDVRRGLRPKEVSSEYLSSSEYG